MGKYIGKRKGVGKITVMEVAQVGVRTRARAMAAMAAQNSGAEKRRKVMNSSGELSFSSSLVKLITPENSASTADSSDRCVSASSDHVMDSCCSSNGSSEMETLKFADLEDERVEIETSRYNLDRRERRETTPSNESQAESGQLESTAKPPEAASSRRILMVEKMPPEAELEEFFAVAEKNIRKQFTEKYNYDILKDVPLEGRYEWAKIKP